MAKKKQPKKQPAAPAKDPQPEQAVDRGPYLPTAHPPAKNPALLIVSVILFLASFAFLVAAAWSSTR
jgi:hypothetical protein